MEGLDARLLTSEPKPFLIGASSEELIWPFSSVPFSFSMHMVLVVAAFRGGSLALMPLPLVVVLVMVVVVVVVVGWMEALLPLSAMLLRSSLWQSLLLRILLQQSVAKVKTTLTLV